jgi:ribonucleoside-diphosphate reductase beta chain
VIVAGYGHFIGLARSFQWEDSAVELARDAEAWAALDDASRRRIFGLVAGFCVGETAVAEELGPFEAAASSERMAACFRTQAVDELRHARFFERVAVQVAGLPEEPEARRATLRGLVGAPFLALFEDRLPAIAAGLAAGREGLAAAVGLYHMVLEGVVFLAGQHALLGALEQATVALPGTREGLELVLRDERWHIGFGARCLQDAGLSVNGVELLLTEGQRAAGAWEDLVSPQAVAQAALLHRRRLWAAGLGRQRVAA